MKIIKLSILLFFTAFTTTAQNPIKESNTFSLSGKIETMKVVPGGILLVGTSEGLTAIEAHNNKVVYQFNSLGKIKTEELAVLEDTPYVILTRGYSKVILNYFTGKEIFNTAKSEMSAVFSVLPDFTAQKIYMFGSTKQGYSLGVFDINTLQNEGIISFNDKKTMGAYIDVTRYYESNGKLFVRTEKGIVCIDKGRFKMEWTYGGLEKLFQYIKVIADEKNDLYFITESDGNKSNLHKIDKNGKLTIKKPSKLEANTQALTLTSNGLLVQMMDTKNSYFQMYNVENADPKWEKPTDIKGSIFFTEQTTNNFIYASNDGLINSLDLSTGKQQLRKEIKTGMWFKNIVLLENDLLFYITSTNMGIANLKTGEYANEPIKFKKATNLISAYDKKSDRFVVSTGNELFFIKTDGSITKIRDIDFKEDETPTKIEFRDNGILFGAKQSNVFISYDGKTIYESYYKAPGQSVFGQIAMGALAVAAARAGNQSTSMGYGTLNDNLKGANGMIGEMNKKFSATKQTKDFLYILTKIDGDVGLVKLKKDTGEKIADLILKDKKPVYEVDDDFGILYFQNDPKQIKSYDLR